jgi:pantothenate kinase
LALLRAAARDPRLAGRIAHVPMDGFHLPSATLDALGRRDRKGAPDTFDARGYAALLAAVRVSPRAVVRAPAFDHAVGEPAADAIQVGTQVDLVVSEGNYLLLDDPAWHPVRESLDETWFCALGDPQRRDRLAARHVAAGRAPDDAGRWVAGPDEANALLVAPGAALADLVLVDGRIALGSP